MLTRHDVQVLSDHYGISSAGIGRLFDPAGAEYVLHELAHAATIKGLADKTSQSKDSLSSAIGRTLNRSRLNLRYRDRGYSRSRALILADAYADRMEVRALAVEWLASQLLGQPLNLKALTRYVDGLGSFRTSIPPLLMAEAVKAYARKPIAGRQAKVVVALVREGLDKGRASL